MKGQNSWAQREEQNKLCAVQVCSETRARRAWCRIPTWQPNPAEVAEDELEGIARVDCVEQSGVPSVEPRGHRVSQSVHREVECVRCRDSGDCDGCSEARDGAATRSHTEECRWCIGCRECIEQTLGDDMGQQKLQETEQRREVTGGQESRAPRVERPQEGRDAELTAMHARDDGECSEF